MEKNDSDSGIELTKKLNESMMVEKNDSGSGFDLTTKPVEISKLAKGKQISKSVKK